MTTLISAIACFIVAVVGAWIAYQLFSKNKGPVVGPFGAVEAISKRKENGMDVIEYKISLPVSPSTDVVKKILTIRRADTGAGMFSPIKAVDLPNEQTSIHLEAVQDTRVDLELVAVDDSNNRSDPVYAYFTALDTIKPVLTGEMTVEAVGETTSDPEASPAETPPTDDEDPGETETNPVDEGESAEEPTTSGPQVTNS